MNSFFLQSKSLNQDSGLFSPPSIMKSALGGSEMMLDPEMDPMESESVKVLPVNQYYYNNLPHLSSNQHHHVSHQNNYHHQTSLSSNMLSQSFHSQMPQMHSNFVGGSSSNNNNNVNLTTQQQHQPMYHSTPVGGSGGSSTISFAGQNGVRNHVSGGSSSSRNVQTNGVVYDKENQQQNGGPPFPMLRHEDDDLDLGGFQLSKSIFNPGQFTNQQPNGFLGSSVMNSNSNNRKDGGQRVFGTQLTNLPQNSLHRTTNSQLGGGYFRQGSSPAKIQIINQLGSVNGGFTKVHNNVDLFGQDSNSQASLPTDVSSPASTVSYYENAGHHQGNTRPAMEFLDVNDDYWLDFVQ